MSSLFEGIEAARLLNVSLCWRAMSSSVLVSCELKREGMACHVINTRESEGLCTSVVWRAMSSHWLLELAEPGCPRGFLVPITRLRWRAMAHVSSHERAIIGRRLSDMLPLSWLAMA